MRRRWLFWVGIAVSVAFLYLALRNVRLDEVLDLIRGAQLAWIALGIAVYFLSVALRAQRWALLLSSAGHLRVGQLYPIVIIGYMGNNIYPARIGELLRAYVLRQSYAMPFATSLASILIERVLDSAVLLGFVVAGLPITQGIGENLRLGLLALGAALVVGIALVMVMSIYARPIAERAEQWVGHLLPRRLGATFLDLFQRFLLGTQSLKSPRVFFATLALTLATWLVETVKYWCVAHALGISVPFLGLMLVNGLSNLFTVIPGAPGGIGTFDSGGVLGMVSLGVQPSLAFAYVLVLHAALWFPVTTLGFALMIREGLRWSDLSRAETMQVSP